ncbi:alpha-hydroxy acid oxidase [Ferrimonas gelatinilytica]|uniref:Alpha-hydroxy acid oxidase n=1 Tax=Ferrimonas gelatinilytica TaxID=1255257 RepID=A0ABP9SBA8_9GAMM
MSVNAINIHDLKKLAKRRLPRPAFDYLDGGADDEQAMANNQSAFARYRMVPRVLEDVSHIDMSTKLLGQTLSMPLIVSPLGQQRMFHHEADRAGARAASRAETLFTLSSFSSFNIEQVAEASNGPKMFQIYVMADDALNQANLRRAKAAGYQSVCLTVDSVIGGNRERDLRNGLTMPVKLTLSSMIEFAKHPVWVWRYLYGEGRDLANMDGAPQASDGQAFMTYLQSLAERRLTWEHAERMIQAWDGPFAIKGISAVADAVKAAKIGASAIFISNHGGRQMDSAPAPIDLVAEIRAAVGDKVELIVDGGITRGSDIIKALALGADACAIGKAYGYGLAAAGEEGALRALEILRAELQREMILLGAANVEAVKSLEVKRL